MRKIAVAILVLGLVACGTKAGPAAPVVVTLTAQWAAPECTRSCSSGRMVIRPASCRIASHDPRTVDHGASHRGQRIHRVGSAGAVHRSLTCGFKTGACYPESQTLMSLGAHVDSLTPGLTGDGKRPMKVARRVFKERRYDDDGYTEAQILVDYWAGSSTVRVATRPHESATRSPPWTDIHHQHERS